MKKILFTLLVLLTSTGITSVGATTLTSSLNVDNTFKLYISTNDSTLGTLVGSGIDWGTNYSFTSTLTAGVTNYLHIVATNLGGPGGFLGAFTLSGDNNFLFANGTETLLTGDAGITQSLSGYGSTFAATTKEGAINTGPWGSSISGYGSLSPQWVWNYNSTNASDYNVVYFSAQILSVAAVPEPGSIALLGLGLLALLALRKRKTQSEI